MEWWGYGGAPIIRMVATATPLPTGERPDAASLGMYHGRLRPYVLNFRSAGPPGTPVTALCPLSVPIHMSGKSKLVLLLVALALVYFAVSGGAEPVEVEVEE